MRMFRDYVFMVRIAKRSGRVTHIRLCRNSAQKKENPPHPKTERSCHLRGPGVDYVLPVLFFYFFTSWSQLLCFAFGVPHTHAELMC
jgi:hypothetical protein